jgi:hypothetical protein
MTFSVDAQVGPYQIISLLGIDGIGEVFFERHRKLARSGFVDIVL